MAIMKKCCGLCPYSRKNTLFLLPERAEEFAINAENPYTDFVCHRTGVVDEDNPDEDKQGNIIWGEKSLGCAGFHALQMISNGKEEESEIELDFADHFEDWSDMYEHHLAHYESQRNQKQ